MAGSPPQGPIGTQHDCRARTRIGGCSRSGPLTHFPCSQVGSSYTRRHISTDCGSSRSISHTPDTQIPHSGSVHHQISLILMVVCHIGGHHQSILPCSSCTKATEGLCVRRRPPKIPMPSTTVRHRPLIPYILTHLMSPGVAPLRRTGVGVVVYLDDLLVLAPSAAVCLQHTQQVVRCLTHLDFQVSVSKSLLSHTHSFGVSWR